MAAYQEDLAFVHEAGFAALAQAAAREVRARLRPPARVVDLGCGGGTLADDLVRAGFQVAGCDLSAAMVELARQRVPRAQFTVADALAFDVPRCSAVTCVGEVLNYALAEREPEALHPFLGRVHVALRPAGFLLADFATTAKAQGSRTATREGRGWRVEAAVTVEGDRLTRTIDTWRAAGPGPERHSREVHRQRLLDPDWLDGALRQAGFQVEKLGAYDDHILQEGWDAVVATKR